MKRKIRFSFASTRNAFTLVEMLVVIAIIGIMSALIVASVTNSAEDTRLVLARQQQAVVQEALNSWVAAQSATASIQAIRTNYNARSAAARFSLATNYLDVTTISHFSTYTSNTNQPRTEAMAKSSLYLTFPDWSSNAGSYPRVDRGP